MLDVKDISQSDTILLDMDGTLLDLYFDNYFWAVLVPERYAQKQQLSFDTAYDHCLSEINLRKGTLDWYCLDYWADCFGLDIIGLKREIADRVALRPGVLPFLTALRDSNKSVILLTNSHPAGVDIKLDAVPIGSYFDHIVSSHEYGLAKENPNFWPAFASEHLKDSGKALLIDDTESVLQAASDFGIAFTWSIAQPDSSKPVRPCGRFPAVVNFDEVTPFV